MTAVGFDTLKLAQAFRSKTQFDHAQSEGMASAIAEAMQSDLATKADLGVLHGDLAVLRSDLTTLRSDLKGDIAETKTEVIKWVCGMIGFQTVVILGAAVALSGFYHH